MEPGAAPPYIALYWRLLSALDRGFFRAAMRGMPPLAAGLGCQRVIARKAALVGIHALTALAPGFGRQRRILRKTPLFVRHTLAALARDRPLLLGIHGGEAPRRNRRFLGRFH